MKKIVATLLMLTLCLALFACGSDYPPVKSTDEELETVMVMTLDDEKYEVPYELYRTFFLQYKSEIDGGDESVWSGDKNNEYIDKIDKLIFERISEIYAVFHLCDKVGIDIYSDIVEETIESYVKASVEGGSVNGMLFQGFEGNYDDYLAYLKKINMNYSVQELLFRYSVASELLDSYYADKGTSDEINYTKETVKEFYDSEECVRVLRAFLQTSTETDKAINTPERAERIRNGMASLSDEADIGTYIIGNTLENESIRDGMVIGKYSLEPAYYAELTETAFALGLHKTSKVIEVITVTSNGYFILFKADKSDEHFEKCYTDIEAVYVQNVIGKNLGSIKEALVSSISTTSALTQLDRSTISM